MVTKMDWSGYEAAVLRAKIAGQELLSCEEHIISILKSRSGAVKREELVDQLSVRTMISRQDVHENISSILSKLVKAKTISQLGGGYYSYNR